MNKPAVAGLIIIVLAICIALLGYLVIPDKTTDANDSISMFQHQPPGFSIKVMKDRDDRKVEEPNWFNAYLFGRPNPFTVRPIESYTIEGAFVKVKEYNVQGKIDEIRYPLIDIVEPLWIGASEKFKADSLGNFRVEGDKVLYLDISNQQQSISIADLKEKFENNHIETRFYVLGTDLNGRDMFSRLMLGFRISLSIGFISVLISAFLGIFLGATAGFFGGRVDNAIMWFMSVVWSIPGIMLVIAISLALQSKDIWVAFVAVGLTTWVEIARVVRGQILSLKEKLFVEAAKALGVSSFRIIYYHILPNMTGPLIVILTSNFANAILTEAGLSFLGLGVQPPTPSWGVMVSEGFERIASDGGFHLVFFPSLFISLMVLAFNLLGNGLRDAYDPKTTTKQ
ncbi:MAG: ABC transporter permease [Cytophagales bacterium]|nr:MAG: ABC transporter permease [Cytophagales bacterium]